MRYTIGIDIGSTYIKGVVLDEKSNIAARHMLPTGSNLQGASEQVANETAEKARIGRRDLAYCITTGYGRYQYEDRDLQVTDLTATARGAVFLFPETRTVLDIGGQTMKASRLDGYHKVKTFRLNDKCASGTGMFLEKTVRYMGYDTDGIDGLLKSAKEAATISGVCTVFAESEVINHLSNSVPPEDIMYGAAMSLTKRSVQLLRRLNIEPQVTLVGGIMRWSVMAKALRDELKMDANVAQDDLPQFTAALGCAILGHIRLRKLGEAGSERKVA